jgi:hypothetical protein
MGCSLVALVAWMPCLVSMVQWGHGAGTPAHRDCGRTWRLQRASRQLAEATLVQLRTRCGPCQAGDGLFPGGTGSLYVLLGVHGAVGSWVCL